MTVLSLDEETEDEEDTTPRPSTSDPFMVNTDGRRDTQLSGFAKQLAPMIASMVVKEIHGEQGGGLSTKTGRRKGLKQAAKHERMVESPEQRHEFLVSATHMSKMGTYKIWIARCS